MNAALAAEIQTLAPSALIEMFELDATAIGGSIVRFHAGTNLLSANLVWQGHTYTRFPCEAQGFEFNGQSQFPRPKFRVSNVLSAITALLLSTNDLMGAKLTRKRTLAKFLDAVNFPGGVNASADPTAEITDDVYYIDRKSHEDKDTVEFELACAVDLVGVNLPRRQIIQNICPWRYRGSECGYTGAPFFDINDVRITNALATSSFARSLLSTYDAAVAAKATLDLKNAALTAATSTRDADCAVQILSTQFHYSNASTIGAGDYLVAVDAPGQGTNGFMRAFWNGAVVTLGTTYRKGAFKADNYLIIGAFGATVGSVYEIQQWGVNSGLCTTGTTAYTTALSARDAAQTAYNSAISAYNTAFAALPVDDPIYNIERCGKRLTSCKARFGETAELPFGGFPAASLFK
jgi:lambda family phage minor tail protein L